MYYLVFGILYLISLLPFTILYLLADIFYVVVYYIIRYRRKVVFQNLVLAFPEKTSAERKAIAKKFYHNFCDNWIETIKLISISRAQLDTHLSCDIAVLESIFASGRCCHLLVGHQFNWEWGNALVPSKVPVKFLGVYAPISSRATDRLLLYIRGRFGSVLLPFNDMRRAMLPHRHTQYVLALIADQNPSNPQKSYWLNFMHTPTAFLQGPEKGARLGNVPVAYIGLNKLRRGYYHLEAKLLCDNPATTTEGDITQKYAATLEASIRANPSGYLWSHRRWKHEWKNNYSKLWVGEEKPAQV